MKQCQRELHQKVAAKKPTSCVDGVENMHFMSAKSAAPRVALARRQSCAATTGPNTKHNIFKEKKQAAILERIPAYF